MMYHGARASRSYCALTTRVSSNEVVGQRLMGAEASTAGSPAAVVVALSAWLARLTGSPFCAEGSTSGTRREAPSIPGDAVDHCGELLTAANSVRGSIKTFTAP